MRLHKFIGSFRKVLGFVSFKSLLVLLCCWSFIDAGALVPYYDGSPGSLWSTSVGLVIFLSVNYNHQYAHGATIRDGKLLPPSSSSGHGRESDQFVVPINSTIDINTIKLKNVTSRRSRGRGGRQLKLIAPALQTMGCLPKFFCGMNSKAPSQSTSTLNDLAYLIRFAMVDEDSSENKGKDNLHSEEYSDERTSDERRKDNQKFEHLAEESLILDDPEYLNFVWKDMKNKLKNKFKDGKMDDDEILQQMVNELDEEDKTRFKIPNIFSGLKSLVRIGRSIPDSGSGSDQDVSFWQNDTLRYSNNRRSRAFWDTEEFDEQMKLAARIGKTTNDDTQCTSTFNLCPYSVEQMKDMVAGKIEPPRPHPWYVNNKGPQEGDLTTQRPRPRTTTRVPRPTTKSPRPISHAIYVLHPDSLDGRRPSPIPPSSSSSSTSSILPLKSRIPAMTRPTKKPYVGNHEAQDDEVGFDVPALTYEKDIIEPTSSIKIIKLQNGNHDPENDDGDDDENDKGNFPSSEEDDGDEPPKRKNAKKPTTITITKQKVPIGLPRPKYTLKHKYQDPLKEDKGTKKNQGKSDDDEDSDEQDLDLDNKSKNKSQESEQSDEEEPTKPSATKASIPKDKESDESNESENNQKTTKANTNKGKDDKSSEESEEQDFRNNPPVRPTNSMNNEMNNQQPGSKPQRPRPIRYKGLGPSPNPADRNPNGDNSDESSENESSEKKKQTISNNNSKDDKSSEEKPSSEENDGKTQALMDANKRPDSEEYEYSQEMNHNKRPSSLRPIKYSYFKGKPRPTMSMSELNGQRPTGNTPEPTPPLHHTQKPSFFSSWFGGNKKPQDNPQNSDDNPGPHHRPQSDSENKWSMENNQGPGRPNFPENRPPPNHRRRPDVKQDDDDSSSEEDNNAPSGSSPSPIKKPTPSVLPPIYGEGNTPSNKNINKEENNRPVITDPEEDVRPAQPNQNKPHSRFPQLPRFPPPARRPQPIRNPVSLTRPTSSSTTEKSSQKNRKDQDDSGSKEDDKSEESSSSKEDDDEKKSVEVESKESSENSRNPLHVKNIFSKSSVASLGENTYYSNNNHNGQSSHEPPPPPPPPIANWKPLNLDEKTTKFVNLTKSPNAQATLITPQKSKLLSPGDFSSYEKLDSDEEKEDDSNEGAGDESKEAEKSSDEDEMSHENNRNHHPNQKDKKRFEDDEADNPEPPKPPPLGFEPIPELGEVISTQNIRPPDPHAPVGYPPLAPVSNFQDTNEVKIPSTNPKPKPSSSTTNTRNKNSKPSRNPGGDNTKNANSGPGTNGGPPSVPNPGSSAGNRRPPGGGNPQSGNNPSSGSGNGGDSSEEKSEEEVGKSSEEEEIADKTSEEEDDDEDRGRSSIIKKLKKSPSDTKNDTKIDDKEKSKSTPSIYTTSGIAPLPPIYKWATNPTTLKRLTQRSSIKVKPSLKPPRPTTKDNFYSKPLSPKLVQYLRDTYGNSYVMPDRKRSSITTTTTTTTAKPKKSSKDVIKSRNSYKSKSDNRNTSPHFQMVKLGSQSTEVIHFDEFDNEHEHEDRIQDFRIGHRTGSVSSTVSKTNKSILPPIYGKLNFRG